MNGYCDGCDRFRYSLVRKGKLWLCSLCLRREL